jgi:hypothetical protein
MIPEKDILLLHGMYEHTLPTSVAKMVDYLLLKGETDQVGHHL